MYNRFENLLKERGVTAYRVAKETNIATATLSDWKKGRSTPKIDKLKKIADYFRVSLDYLTGDSDDPVDYDNFDEEIPEYFDGDVKAYLDFKKAEEDDHYKELINPLTGKKMTKREVNQLEKVKSEALLLFDDENVSEEDKEKLMMALNDMFWKSKQKNKEKYAQSHKK